VLAGSIAFAILAGYALALWWLLRREGAWTVVALVALCGLSLALRVVLSDGYPWGLFEDEPKVLACAVQALSRGTIFGESCIHIPYLLFAVFDAPLVPYLGATRWAIRLYPILTSVLATPAVFGAARAFGMRVGPSLAAGGLVAVLPWSLFYGRIALGGELIFHQALLLGGLGRLLAADGGAPDTLLAGFGLCLLLWDYWAGRAMMSLPIIAAVLASGWRRAWCLAVIPLALIGWYPHLATGPADAHVGLSLQPARGAPVAGSFHPGFAEHPWETLVSRTEAALQTYIHPVAFDSIFTMRSVAKQPRVLLGIAAIGLLASWRRGLFLLGGFAAGLLPGILSGSFGISAHRIIMSYLFVVFAEASALDVVPWRWPRAAAAVALFAFAAWWSVPRYFSAAFWPPDWRWTVDRDNTALNEAVADALPDHLIYMRQIGYFGYFDPEPPVDEMLTVDNWLPRDGEPVTYLFTWQAEPLRAEYEHMLPKRVLPVGRHSFLVSFEAGDWSWLRQYGWAYEVRCGHLIRRAQVPFLYSLGLGALGFPCTQPMQHIWRAHWHGPAAEMIMQFSGTLRVDAPGVAAAGEGFEQRVPFTMPADSDVTITLTAPPTEWPLALLFERARGGERVPAWDRFTPPTDDPAAVPPPT
jgi:hypothetical protein